MIPWNAPAVDVSPMPATVIQSVSSAPHEGVNADARTRLVFPAGDTRCITHGAPLVVLGIRQQARKARIDPRDDGVAGAEIPLQHQAAQGNTADAPGLRLQEEGHVGLAESVDGLHRVADAEQ